MVGTSWLLALLLPGGAAGTGAMLRSAAASAAVSLISLPPISTQLQWPSDSSATNVSSPSPWQSAIGLPGAVFQQL